MHFNIFSNITALKINLFILPTESHNIQLQAMQMLAKKAGYSGVRGSSVKTKQNKMSKQKKPKLKLRLKCNITEGKSSRPRNLDTEAHDKPALRQRRMDHPPDFWAEERPG